MIESSLARMSSNPQASPIPTLRTEEEVEQFRARMIELRKKTQRHIDNMIRLEKKMGRR
jgi:hypothetical protein